MSKGPVTPAYNALNDLFPITDPGDAADWLGTEVVATAAVLTLAFMELDCFAAASDDARDMTCPPDAIDVAAEVLVFDTDCAQTVPPLVWSNTLMESRGWPTTIPVIPAA